MSSSCGDINNSLAGLQSAVSGIGGLIDSKIAPLLAKIEALEAAIARAGNNDFVKKGDFEKLVLPILGASLGMYATKSQLEYFYKEASGRIDGVSSKADDALSKAADGVDAKRLAYEERVKRTQLEYEHNALKTQVNKLPSDSQLSNELKARVSAVESKAAKVEFETAANKAETIKVKGEVTNFRTENNLAKAEIKAATNKIDDVSRRLGVVAGKADDALGGLRKFATKFGDDIAQLGGKLAKGLGALSPLLALLGVVSTLLEVALQAGTLVVLDQRLDEIDRGMNLLNQAISDVYGQLSRLKSYFEGRLQELYELFSARSNELLEEMHRLFRSIKFPEIEALKTQITNLNNSFANFQSGLVPTIDGRIPIFLAGLGLGALASRLTNLENATKNMPQCRYNPVLDQQTLASAQANNKLSLGMQAFNTAQMQSVQSKLGAQLPGGLAGAASRIINNFNKLTNLITSSFSKTWNFLKLDRVLNVLTFAASIHNALMLSRSLGDTLLDVTSSVINAIGFRDANNLPFDLQEFFGQQFENFIKGIVGVEAYEGNKAKFNAANRIISSAANLLWSMQSMLYNAIEGIEIIGGWIAKMANGMKFDGLVSDNLWGWMNPNPNFKNPVFKAMEKISDLDDAASQIYMISTNVVDFQDTAQQLGEQKAALQKAMTDYTDLATTQAIQEDFNNQSPEINPPDTAPAEEQE